LARPLAARTPSNVMERRRLSHLVARLTGRWHLQRLSALEEKIVKFADPERREGLRDAIRQTGGGFGVARYPLAEMKVNWISSDAPNATELKEKYEGWTIGEIAARENKLDDAITHFTAAMKIEDEQLYTEPPDWYYPIRHSLGAVLLKAGKPAEAEQLYRDDLKRFPENGWALFGLSQALKAQQKTGEATAVDQRFAKAWAGADVKLEASRF